MLYMLGMTLIPFAIHPISGGRLPYRSLVSVPYVFWFFAAALVLQPCRLAPARGHRAGRHRLHPMPLCLLELPGAEAAGAGSRPGARLRDLPAHRRRDSGLRPPQVLPARTLRRPRVPQPATRRSRAPPGPPPSSNGTTAIRAGSSSSWPSSAIPTSNAGRPDNARGRVAWRSRKCPSGRRRARCAWWMEPSWSVLANSPAGGGAEP